MNSNRRIGRNKRPSPSSPKQRTSEPAPDKASPASSQLQRTIEDPAGASPAEILGLQRTVGNRAVNRLVASQPPEPPAKPGKRTVQFKLTVGPAGDAYEQEADRVASQVMRMAEPSAMPVQKQDEDLGVQAKPLGGAISRLQRQEDEDDELEDEEMQAKPAAGGLSPVVQREGEEEDELEDEEVQGKRNDGGEGFTLDSGVEGRLRATAGGGDPLPGHARNFMESRFGTDFGGVRVHTGSEAAQLNRQVNAQAFTHGSNIYFGAGRYNPASTGGKQLLAHELTHVVQQTGGAQLKRNAGQENVTKSEPAVQRYPENVFAEDAAVNWQEDTAAVTRPGEGVSGGVYFFQGKTGPTNRVVIKPEYKDNAGNVGATEGFLRAMGVKVPKSRVAPTGSVEEVAIRTTAAAKGHPIPDSFELLGEQNPLTYLRVMDTAPGKSVASSAKKAAGSTNGVDELIGVLNSQSLMIQIGKLVAFDAFIGNPDRIRTFGANLGNIMLQQGGAMMPTILSAIDNESAQITGNIMQKLVHPQNIKTPMQDIGDLFDSKEQFFNWLKDGIEVAINNQQLLEEHGIDISNPQALHGMDEETYNLTGQTFSQAQHFKDYPGFDKWKNWFFAGIEDGIDDLKWMLQRQKKKKKALKKSFKAQGANWDSMRVREKYLTLRDGGMGEAEALEEARRYAKYRRARRNTWKGFKWTQKLRHKFGGF